MENWTPARTVFVLALLAGGSCQPTVESRNYATCDVTRNECHIYYSISSGYGRYCAQASVPCPQELAPAPLEPARDAGVRASAPPVSAAPVASVDDRGAAPFSDDRRYSAFDIACTRDSQCGPGKCLAGECYYGCQSDAQCGSGDRCGVETGTRICLPDPNPPIQCTRTAQCDVGFLCLNASCRQTCEATEDCHNLLDRCGSGVCQPDRRPLGQCVLNSECPAGSVCLDGACVDACANTPDGGICLAPSPGRAGQPGSVVGAPPTFVGTEPGSFPLVDAGPPVISVDAGTPAEAAPLEPAPPEPAPLEPTSVESAPVEPESSAVPEDVSDAGTVESVEPF